MPRGSLLVFLTNVIGMCNITPFQAGEKDRLEKLDSVNAKLTAFHNFIRESRITCRVCGQCSDNEQTGRVQRVEDGFMPGRRDKRQDVQNMRHVDRVQNDNTTERIRQHHGDNYEHDRHPRTLRDHRDRDTGIRRESQKEQGSQADDAANIEEVDAHTVPNCDKPRLQQIPRGVPLSTWEEEGNGQPASQAGIRLAELLDNRTVTKPDASGNQGDLISHRTQEDTSGIISPNTEEQAIQARRDAVEDRVPASQQKAQTQNLNTNATVTSEMMEVLTQNEEEATLVEPVTQVESVRIMMETVQALAQELRDLKNNASKGPIQDNYGTKRHGSQGDDELSADDIDADKESLSPDDIVQQSDGLQQQCDAVENDEMLDTSGRSASENESDSTEENGEIEPTPDTSMSDTLDVWHGSLAKSGPPENLNQVAETVQLLRGTRGATGHRERCQEVRVRILNAEIASEVKSLNDIKLKQCLEREIKSTEAHIDRCKTFPSGEIRIWTTDDRGAQILRQVNGWMPGAFGGLQIQRKNTTVVVPKI
ncbi:MAG: hypothetical protein Q9176_006704 [Flavoplaca citrina]